MSFPTSHKTVFVLNHSLSSSSGVKVDLESLSKLKINPQVNISSPQIPLLPISKTIWTCVVESIAEYCRIVWDIFSTTRLVRFIAVDKAVHRLNGWEAEDQNLTSLANIFVNLGSPLPDFKIDLEKGLRAAVEALTEPTEVQHMKRTSLTEDATKVLNKGRVIVVTGIENEAEVVNIKEQFYNLLIQGNKVAAATDNLIPINHCDLIILNYIKESSPILVSNGTWHDLAPLMSFELFNIPCGSSLAPKLCSLVLRHYELASTTVTGIPMKEEQNANSSANYDVELFHPSSAHTAILKGIPSETAHLRTLKEGTDYETITLKWCTPRSSASLEIQHCSSAYKITSVDVNSRPSSCLTNFLLNGRWVMLEMPRKSGSKVISHMLASHGGDIYIHTLYTSRSVLEDPPSVSESVGGRVTDYRIPDFSDVIRMNMLAPQPKVCLEEGEDRVLPLDSSAELLKRHTKIWPITLSSSFLFSLGHVVVPLRNIYLKNELTEDEIVECKNVIFSLMNMENRGENLQLSALSRSKMYSKREEQYKKLWNELENYLQSHLYSRDHQKVLDCLIECQNKDENDFKKQDKNTSDPVSVKADANNGYNQMKVSQSDFSNRDLKNSLIGNTDERKRSRSSNKHSLNGSTPVSKRRSLNLYTVLENKLNAQHALKRSEFAGKLNAENRVAKLYSRFQKEKEMEESSRLK